MALIKVTLNELHSVPFVFQTDALASGYSVQYMRHPYKAIPSYYFDDDTSISHLRLNVLSQLPENSSLNLTTASCNAVPNPPVEPLDVAPDERIQTQANELLPQQLMKSQLFALQQPVQQEVSDQSEEPVWPVMDASFHDSVQALNVSEPAFFLNNTQSLAEFAPDVQRTFSEPTIIEIGQQLSKDVDLTQELQIFLKQQREAADTLKASQLQAEQPIALAKQQADDEIAVKSIVLNEPQPQQSVEVTESLGSSQNLQSLKAASELQAQPGDQEREKSHTLCEPANPAQSAHLSVEQSIEQQCEKEMSLTPPPPPPPPPQQQQQQQQQQEQAQEQQCAVKSIEPACLPIQRENSDVSQVMERNSPKTTSNSLVLEQQHNSPQKQAQQTPPATGTQILQKIRNQLETANSLQFEIPDEAQIPAIRPSRGLNFASLKITANKSAQRVAELRFSERKIPPMPIPRKHVNHRNCLQFGKRSKPANEMGVCLFGGNM